jgi:hypothetical protein
MLVVTTRHVDSLPSFVITVTLQTISWFGGIIVSDFFSRRTFQLCDFLCDGWSPPRD